MMRLTVKYSMTLFTCGAKTGDDSKQKYHKKVSTRLTPSINFVFQRKQ